MWANKTETTKRIREIAIPHKNNIAQQQKHQQSYVTNGKWHCVHKFYFTSIIVYLSTFGCICEGIFVVVGYFDVYSVRYCVEKPVNGRCVLHCFFLLPLSRAPYCIAIRHMISYWFLCLENRPIEKEKQGQKEMHKAHIQ